MAGKKKKGGKRKKDEALAIKAPQFVSLDDIVKQQEKFNQRVHDIQYTNEKIKRLIDHENENKIKIEEETKWKKYLACDGLPNAADPIEIREFLCKWDHYENAAWPGRVSWLLEVDERSILTQDVEAPNKTLKYLRMLRKDFGIIYQNHLERLLIVFEELNVVLETNKIENTGTYNDLLDLKNDILKKAQSTLDIFTYRVVRSAPAYMEPIDPQTAEYSYKCETFQLHIWTFRNVPIRFTVSLMPKKEVDLSGILVNILLPFVVLCDNLVLRGLHMNYDHYSESTKTYDIPNASKALEDDLEQFLLNEWEQKKRMREEIKAKMIRQRQEYEEMLLEKEEKEKQKLEKMKGSKSKGKIDKAKQGKKDAKTKGKKERKRGGGKEKKEKKGKKGKKRAKPMPIPPVVEKDTFPNIEKEFANFDRENYEMFLRSINPSVFNLEDGEINLREYILIGGIYEFNFVRKPKQYVHRNIIMKWLEIPEILRYRNKNCHIKDLNFIDLQYDAIRKEQRKAAGADYMEDYTDDRDRDRDREGGEGVEDEGVNFPRLQLDDEESALTFFIITFKIPQEICRWSIPTICQWYEVEEIIGDEAEEEEAAEKTTKFKDTDTKEYELQNPVIINDFILSNFLERRMIFNIIEHLIPRIYSTHEFKNDNIQSRRSTVKKFFFDDDFAIQRDVKIEKMDLLSKTPADRLFPHFQKVQPVLVVPLEDEHIKNPQIMDKSLRLFSTYLLELQQMQRSKYPYFKEVENITQADNVSDKSTTVITSQVGTMSSKKKLDGKKRKNNKKSKKKSEDKKSKDHKDPYGKVKAKKGFKSVAEVVKAFQSLKNTVAKKHAMAEAEEEGEGEVEGESSSSIGWSLGLEESKESINENLECFDNNFIYPKWSTKNIFKSEFDHENHEIKIWTNRLGIFAFAFKRYTHLPFTEWNLMPHDEEQDKIVFYAENKYVKFIIYITEMGYTGEVQDYKKQKGLPIIHYSISEPITDIEVLKKELQKYDLNIFAERDAVAYVEDAPEKYIGLEFHTYKCMAIYSTFMKYCKSNWNRVTNHRTIIMKCGIDSEDNAKLEEVQITPDNCQFVRITELCTDLNQVVLKYDPTPRNIQFTPDLLRLIKSVYYRNIQNFKYTKTSQPKLEYNVMTFLQAVRPISFSR